MPIRSLASLLFLLVLLAASVSAPAGAGTEPLAFEHQGRPRSALLHLPPRPLYPLPLVILLHGAGGSGEQALAQYGWRAAADAVGFAVLAADALTAFPDRPADFRANPRFWDDGSGVGRMLRGAIDDAGFLLAAVDRAGQGQRLDLDRLFATGHSSGAGMAQRLALDHAGRIAALGIVSGHLPPGGPPSRPVPMLMIAGALDPISPIDGGLRQLPWGPPQSVAPARTAPEAWARFAGCAAPLTTVEGRVTLERWSPCRGGAEVLYYRIADLGHQWPGAVPSPLGPAVGPWSDAIDGTRLLWRFFQAHPHPR